MQATNVDIASGIQKISLYDEQTAASSFEYDIVGIDKRSMSSSEDERKIEESESRNSAELSIEDLTKSPPVDDIVGIDKRSMSNSEDERKIEESESRNSAEVSVEDSTKSLPVVTPERSTRMDKAIWRSDTCMWRDEDDAADDMSVASGYSYASYDTTATSESVQDIISRLRSETDRRRRRLVRRRSSRRTGDKLQKYIEKRAPRPDLTDPKLGITVEIKE